MAQKLANEVIGAVVSLDQADDDFGSLCTPVIVKLLLYKLEEREILGKW